MADIKEHGTEIIINEDYADLRKRVFVPDSKSKTENWLTSQMHERCSKIEAYKGQIASLKGMLEVAEDELAELRTRMSQLDKLK